MQILYNFKLYSNFIIKNKISFNKFLLGKQLSVISKLMVTFHLLTKIYPQF